MPITNELILPHSLESDRAQIDSRSNPDNGSTLQHTEWTLQFSNLSYAVKQNKTFMKQVLDQAYGEFRSNRLTAILGPSGAGKSSILNVLSGFKATGVSGEIVLNNQNRNLFTFHKLGTYIPQDFAILDLLTVQETLKTSTDLKLSVETTEIEKEKIIDDIIQTLNMETCRHTLARDLSGGERKRLSIAIELVTNPPVMLFDEPTSGLDSVASLQVLTYLRRLASHGRIIVCVIHQPSSRLVKLFDDILVLSRGEVLYCGPQNELLPSFEKAGFKCPEYYNPADFVLEVGSEEENNNVIRLIQSNKEKYSKICTMDSTRNSNLDESSLMLPRIEPESAVDILSDNSHSQTIQITENSAIPVRLKAQVNFWRQFLVLTRRSFQTMSRNMTSVRLRLVMHIVVGILLGIVFWNIGDDAAKVLSNASCIFFVVMFIFFGNAMPSILLCTQDTAVFVREYLNGWYSIRAYYVAKIIADIPLQVICPTLFIIIVYIMTGQLLEFNRILMCWVIALLTAMIGHFLGLVFGSTFGLKLSVFLVPGVSIPLMIFSGYFIRIHELSTALRPLCDISFFRYTLEGFLQAIYGFDRADLRCYIDFCYYKSPKKFLKDLDMLGDRYGSDVIACCLWILVLQVLFYMSLKYRIKRER